MVEYLILSYYLAYGNITHWTKTSWIIKYKYLHPSLPSITQSCIPSGIQSCLPLYKISLRIQLPWNHKLANTLRDVIWTVLAHFEMINWNIELNLAWLGSTLNMVKVKYFQQSHMIFSFFFMPYSNCVYLLGAEKYFLPEKGRYNHVTSYKNARSEGTLMVCCI